MTDAYTFAPGYMVASDGSPALHAEWSAMAEAHIYCDAEPRIYHTGLEPQTNRPPSLRQLRSATHTCEPRLV